jgi:hypothetical protein
MDKIVTIISIYLILVDDPLVLICRRERQYTSRQYQLFLIENPMEQEELDHFL